MRVLLVVHGLSPAALGGTEIYVEGLARVLHERFGDQVFILAREARPDGAEYAVRREDRAGVQVAYVNNTFRLCRSFEETYRNDAIRRIAGRLLDEIRPDLVHIHHLTCLSTDLVVECAVRGLPTLFTLHDYWLICHRGQLLDLDCRRCPGPLPDGCARCVGVAGGAGARLFAAAALVRALEARLPPTPAALLRRGAVRVAGLLGSRAKSAQEMARRVGHIQGIATMVTRFLAPSQTLKRRFIEFGIGEDRITDTELGVDPTPFRGLTRTKGERLRIGFLGSLMVSKAPHVLLQAFVGLPPDAATLHVFGAHASYHGDDGYRHALEPLFREVGAQHVGPVPHSEVPRALAGVDVLVVPSVWLENSPLAIREAFLAGVPVVASNLGGMAELVAHERSGLLFEPGDVADLRRTLRRLVDQPALLDRLRDGIPPVRTLEEDADWTRQLYRTHLPDAGPARRSTCAGTPASPALALSRAAAVVLNYRTPRDTLLAVWALQGSRRPLQDLIVVDNGSGDGSAAYLREHVAGATIVEAGRNLGFSGGSNVGIAEALARGAALVLLVNSDVILPPDSLGHLEATLDREPRAGIAGPVVLSRSDPERVVSLGMSFSPATGRMRHQGYGQRLDTLAVPPCRVVDGVSGCAMLLRREVLDQVGLLADEFFFSFEDLDLCLRARQAGFLTLLAGRAVAYHEGSLSIGPRSARRIYFATRNHLLLAQRAAPEARALPSFARSASIVALNLAHVFRAPEAPVFAGVGAVVRGVWHHARRRYGDAR